VQPLNIAVIGGGSTYTPDLVEGFIRYFSALGRDQGRKPNVFAALQLRKVSDALLRRRWGWDEDRCTSHGD
jgi:hypothetical protein